METCPLPALTISLGMVNGLIRDGPLWIIVECWASNSFKPADSRTDEHAALLGGKLGEVDARILHGGLGSHQGELREAVEVPCLLDPEAGHRVPVTNLAAEVNLELGRVEKGQAARHRCGRRTAPPRTNAGFPPATRPPPCR